MYLLLAFFVHVCIAVRVLPPTILAGYPGDGYTTNGTANLAVLQAARNGVNVVIWNDIALQSEPTSGNPMVAELDPFNMACVVATVKQLEAENLTTTHMVSIGGWGTAHPAAFNPITGQPYTPQQVYSAWLAWNTASAQQYGWNGFDGVDWDMEGANEASSPTNEFTVACLNLVGGFSQLAKADGYLVSLVPCESYFDPTIGNFSQSLLFDYPEWVPYVTFNYHGRNGYAYLVSRFQTSLQQGVAVPTFDFVTVGFYETYSHADFNITVLGMPAATYLENILPKFIEGWRVLFEMEPAFDWPSQMVSINTTQLVIGLGNGWAGSYQSLLIMPDSVGQAYNALQAQGLAPRGAAFWCTSDEGEIPEGQTQPLYLASGLNQYFHTR